MANKMMSCPACGKEISVKATQCPHCGHKQKKPIFKKWWFWLIVVLVIGIIGASNSPDDSSASSGSSVQTSQTVPAPDVPEPSPSEQQPQEESEPSNIFYPGDIVNTNQFSITYQECDSNWTGYDRYFEPSDGNKVVRAYFVFENIGNSDYSCGSWDFDCYADGIACDSYIWSSDSSLSYASLSPGRKLQGYISYEVPIDAEVIELEYEISFWTQDKIIFMIE